MARKPYACAGGIGPRGMSYYRLRRDCVKTAKERGVAVRKYNAKTETYEIV